MHLVGLYTYWSFHWVLKSTRHNCFQSPAISFLHVVSEIILNPPMHKFNLKKKGILKVLCVGRSPTIVCWLCWTAELKDMAYLIAIAVFGSVFTKYFWRRSVSNRSQIPPPVKYHARNAWFFFPLLKILISYLTAIFTIKYIWMSTSCS